ncbi:taste receptor type 2 member 40-like [Aquarana catesbeiana]|uniref:taste receptor type 2 member 40-like n=1 Tax=Aquarana catesbeiana TaxID=8400 RepID=UPI003CC93209
MRRISEGFFHNFSIIPTLNISFCLLSLDVSRHLCLELTPNLNMMTPNSIYCLIAAVLGLGLAIPSNTCIVMGNLDIIRKKGKLSPTDVIFLGKGIVNLILPCLLVLQGLNLVLSPEVSSYIRDLRLVDKISLYFLKYFSFWLTFWLSAHYCTTITNLSYGFFIWVKRIVSNFLSQLIFLTALVTFIMSVLVVQAFSEESCIQSAKNSTETPATYIFYQVSLSYFVPMTFLGIILPFCLSLLCLVLTSSFLLRHVWRVKNNDSGPTRPNLQAHVTALRTIFFLLLIFTSSIMLQVLIFIKKPTESTDPIDRVTWTFRSLSPSVEAAVIFQASSKLRRIILRRFWTRS